MRHRRGFGKGFTLIELMIAVAIIGVMAAVALPAYIDYINNSKRVAVVANFDEAVRLATNEYYKEGFELSVGNASTRPTTDAGWVALLNLYGIAAPGGGQSFITGTTGDPVTGSIGVSTINGGDTLVLVRPPYLKLAVVTATIGDSGIVSYVTAGAAGGGGAKDGGGGKKDKKDKKGKKGK